MTDLLKQQSDAALMDRAGRGKHDAFDVLMRRYESQVITFCYSFVRDAVRAEDMAQEVFIRVFKNAGRYKPVAKFTTWLFRIAANVCINELKREKIRETISLDAPMGSATGARIIDRVASTGELPEAKAERQELQREVRAALFKLPEEQRITLTLVEYNHMKYSEAAEVLGVTTSAIKMRVKRARELLREILNVSERL